LLDPFGVAVAKDDVAACGAVIVAGVLLVVPRLLFARFHGLLQAVLRKFL
jgi:hypothetical protein